MGYIEETLLTVTWDKILPSEYSSANLAFQYKCTPQMHNISSTNFNKRTTNAVRALTDAILDGACAELNCRRFTLSFAKEVSTVCRLSCVCVQNHNISHFLAKTSGRNGDHAETALQKQWANVRVSNTALLVILRLHNFYLRDLTKTSLRLARTWLLKTIESKGFQKRACIHGIQNVRTID